MQLSRDRLVDGLASLGVCLPRAGLAGLLALLSLSVPEVASASQERPRVVLVLSGGGARGAAHVGVLRVLEDARVPIDAVVGTSMGSIVGGLYAAGMSPDDLETAIVDVDWEAVFTDRPPRSQRYFRRKQDDLDFLVRYRVHLKGGRPKLPLGFLQAQKLESLLKFYEITTDFSSDFDRLRIPYRAVATDLADGEAVVIARGSLATAMRASMSIPGLFPPVPFDDRLLIDGGVASNLPVEAALELAPDVLIAVDISTPRDLEVDPGSSIAVIRRLTQFLTKGNVDRSKAKLSERDILIEPDLADISAQDFVRAEEAIQIGERSAHAVIDRLRELGVSPEEWDRWLSSQRREPSPPPVITGVELRNQSPLDDSVVLAHLGIEEGERLDIDQLNDDLSRLYSLGVVEPISFDVEHAPEGVVLTVDLRTRSTGLGGVRFNLVIEDDFDGGDAYELGVRMDRLAVNRRGAEWRADLLLGEHSGLDAEFYQPLDANLRWFVATSAAYERENRFLVSDGRRLAQILFIESRLRLFGGRNLGNWGQVRLAIERGRQEGEILVPEDLIVPADQDFAGWSATMELDTLDSPFYPLSGGSGEVSYTQRREVLGGETESEDLFVRASWALTAGRTTFVPAIEAALDLGHRANFRDFQLGGVFRLSGLEPNELIGQEALLGRVIVYHELGHRRLRLLQPGWFIGGSLEAGNIFRDGESMALDKLIVAGSVFVGADTPLGPIQIGWGWAEGDRERFYLGIGRNFF